MMDNTKEDCQTEQGNFGFNQLNQRAILRIFYQTLFYTLLLCLNKKKEIKKSPIFSTSTNTLVFSTRIVRNC